MSNYSYIEVIDKEKGKIMYRKYKIIPHCIMDGEIDRDYFETQFYDFYQMLNDLVEKDKEIERLNNELELQNIEMGREIERLKEELEQYKQIGIMQFSRPYAKRYLEERRKEIPNLLYPDSEEIYIDYYDLKDRIDRANNFIDQVLLYRIPNKTKEVYEDIETLQNILNGSDKE